MTTGDVYRALWRHKAFILVLTASIVGAAWFLTTRQQKIYQASTTLRIQQQIQDPTQAFGALETGERLARTYAQIAGTRTIATKIYDQLGGEIPLGEIAGHVSGSPIQDLELLAISARSWSPQRATEIANAAPIALRNFISETGTLRDQVIVIEPAAAPGGPASPSLRRNLAAALFLGLIFNGALALLLEVVRDRVVSPEELERLTGKPVLATVPGLELGPRPGFMPADLLDIDNANRARPSAAPLQRRRTLSG